MKLGVFTVLFADRPFNLALDYIAERGLKAVEIGTGNYPGGAHCPMKELLASSQAAKEYLAMIRGKGLEISALSCHGNPLHPDRAIAKAHHDVQRDTIRLAEKLGVRTVVVFSGCPGDSDKAKYPNWVTCPWPDDFSKIVKWQWEKAAPYWRGEASFAAKHGVRLAFEMHPGFLVYSGETMMRLIRETKAANIGANVDPSHLFWQGQDPIAVIRLLKGRIFHVHAKDCRIYPPVATKGVLDTDSYGEELKRSWIFRTVGYGHGEDFWTDFVSTLRMIGYDGVLSIEHEDSLMSTSEGFNKGVEFLRRVILTEKRGKMFWA